MTGGLWLSFSKGTLSPPALYCHPISALHFSTGFYETKRWLMLVVGGESHLYLLASGGNLAEATADKQPEKKKNNTQLTRKSKFPPLFALDGKLLSLPGILSRCLESQSSQFGSRAKWLALEVGADSRGRSRMNFFGLSGAATCFHRTRVGTNSCAAIQAGDRDMAQGLQCPRWAGNIEQGLCSTGLRTTILGLQRPACG